MSVEYSQVILAVVLQFVDPVGVAVGCLDALYGTVIHQLLDLLYAQLIAGKPGIVVNHDFDIQRFP